MQELDTHLRLAMTRDLAFAAHASRRSRGLHASRVPASASRRSLRFPLKAAACAAALHDAAARSRTRSITHAATGEWAAQYEYGPFGELVRATGPLAREFNFLFSTKYFDWETGLYYYGYRYYNPATGRWLSRDPIEEEGGLNLYVYVNNTPSSSYDYVGLKTITFIFGFDSTYSKLKPDKQEKYYEHYLSEVRRIIEKCKKLVSTKPCCDLKPADFDIDVKGINGGLMGDISAPGGEWYIGLKDIPKYDLTSKMAAKGVAVLEKKGDGVPVIISMSPIHNDKYGKRSKIQIGGFASGLGPIVINGNSKAFNVLAHEFGHYMGVDYEGNSHNPNWGTLMYKESGSDVDCNYCSLIPDYAK